MSIEESVLKNDERILFRLRALYRAHGYMQYKMSKFEEYDLYARNKDFLISDNVITFTDTNGKLMALKPDVTLSIVKNSRDVSDCVQKVYYNEHVYRVPKGSDSFKEIMQMGVECVGHISAYHVSETLTLAAKTLAEFSDAYVLDVSHLGVLSAFVDRLGCDAGTAKAILACVSEKNTHGILDIAKNQDVDLSATEQLCRLVGMYGESEEILPRLSALIAECGECGREAFNDLSERINDVKSVLPHACLHIDFSVVNSMSYYNGIVFRGFIPGVHTRVLSGGQYDRLLSRMGKMGGAVGFAIYLDLMETLDDQRPVYDVDTLLVTKNTPSALVLQAANARVLQGERVLVADSIPQNIVAARVVYLDEKGEETDANASSR